MARQTERRQGAGWISSGYAEHYYPQSVLSGYYNNDHLWGYWTLADRTGKVKEFRLYGAADDRAWQS